MHGLLRCNINAGVHACGRNGRVTQRCHKSPNERVTSRTGSARKILGILKKLVKHCLGRRRVAFVCLPKPGEWPCVRVSHEMVGRWKSQNRKKVYLYPYVEEPLNSKVIKGFVPELRSRKYFSCFEIPISYVYMLGTFYVPFAYQYMAMVQQQIKSETTPTKTHWEKIILNEIRNHSNTHNVSNIKNKSDAKYTKVNALKEKKHNQLKTIETANTSELSLTQYLINKALSYTYFLWKHQAGNIHICEKKMNKWILKNTNLFVNRPKERDEIKLKL